MKSGLVSIMMPAYNAEAYIGDAIQSVLSQTYPDWELIVVNDGSTDGTALVIDEFTDPRVKKINQANGGEAVARNTALENMQGEFVAFLDADDEFLPNHLEVTVRILQEHPEWDGVYTDGDYIDQKGTYLQRLSSRRRGPFEGWIFEQLVWASDVFGPPLCVLVRRDKVMQHEIRYDPRIVIGPDWDFFTRLSEHVLFGYLDQVTCRYRIHQSNITLKAKQQVKLDSLALCRRKAMQLDSFSKCSIETRSFFFYDLLVNLLIGRPSEQESIMQGSQFRQLNAGEQARLLRLTAGSAIVADTDLESVRNWLNRSLELHPADLRSFTLRFLVEVSPKATARFLKRRYARQNINSIFTPFSDITGV